MGGFVESDAEVVRFDVSVNKMSIVDVLDSWDHLVDQHEDGLEGELSECVLEEGLKGGAHEIHN
jgi:hypothetical protein